MNVDKKTDVKKILIVEDDPEMIEIYNNMFIDKTDEYGIEIESNAEQALQILDEREFDLIILDIIMEPMTGDSFFVYARKDKNIQVPIIVVSVLSETTLENLKKIGKVEFLQKPVSEEDLFKKIREVS